MQLSPITPDERERSLAYHREYSRTLRQKAIKARSLAILERRNKIAAAILAYEISQGQESNG
jgi:hypothetical protein